jgi:hypothetical protein
MFLIFDGGGREDTKNQYPSFEAHDGNGVNLGGGGVAVCSRRTAYEGDGSEEREGRRIARRGCRYLASRHVTATRRRFVFVRLNE